jgi:hypothetical protein
MPHNFGRPTPGESGRFRAPAAAIVRNETDIIDPDAPFYERPTFRGRIVGAGLVTPSRLADACAPELRWDCPGTHELSTRIKVMRLAAAAVLHSNEDEPLEVTKGRLSRLVAAQDPPLEPDAGFEDRALRCAWSFGEELRASRLTEE